MNANKSNKDLDELISGAIGREKPQFDLDKWRQEHKEQIEIYHAQKQPASGATEFDIPRITLWRRVGYLAAALLIVSSWFACFVLLGKVADMSKKVTSLTAELELAKQNAADARTDDTTTINLYLQEHRDFVARHASFSETAPEPAQMRLSLSDVVYYELLGDEPEHMSPGIIVRGPSSEREIHSSKDPVISNGHTLTLSEAQQLSDFELRAPARLFPGFCLDQIRRIDGRDALQLLYTNGIDSISLFEQSLDGRRGLEARDFREYAVYRQSEQPGGTILAWRDDEVSYVLIGNIEMSQLMDMAQSISASN